jgi:hypothetical protein
VNHRNNLQPRIAHRSDFLSDVTQRTGPDGSTFHQGIQRMPSSKADSTQISESRIACSKSNSTEVVETDKTAFADQMVTIDRRKPNSERRTVDPNALDVGVMKNPRRKKQRRRHIDPTTCERDYSDPEIEFMRAMDDYKHKSGRMFPTCSEVLEVVRDLGYFRLREDQIELLGLVHCDDASAEHIDEGAEELDDEAAEF